MVLKAPTAKLLAKDAKPHMVVCVWFSAGVGEECYLYKDATTSLWFVYSKRAVMGCRLLDGRDVCFLTTDADGYFEGVTVDDE